MSTPETVQTVVAWVLMLGGSFFALVGAFGTWRLPDFWSRLHAASVTDSAGMILMIAGMCVYSGLTLVTVKLIVIGIFLFITGPTATHAVANAALVSGLRPQEAEGLVADEPTPLSGRDQAIDPETEKVGA
ncbi:MAG: monovalent cation/H(+) antiporter subunit G [Paracoccaceae bacterium]